MHHLVALCRYRCFFELSLVLVRHQTDQRTDDEDQTAKPHPGHQGVQVYMNNGTSSIRAETCQHYVQVFFQVRAQGHFACRLLARSIKSTLWEQGADGYSIPGHTHKRRCRVVVRVLCGLNLL